MVGYGVGYVGQGVAYGFMSTYLVVFLTNAAGISSSLAATISSVALLVEVVMGMIVGNMSDTCTSKMGKRRPFMLVAGITILPIFALLFMSVPFKGPLQIIYYIVFAMCFRVMFSTWEIPNQALGAELASDYDDRTRLRTLTRYFSIIGNGTGYILPLLVIEAYNNDIQKGWWVIGILIGAITALSWLLAVVTNRGKGKILRKEDLPKKTEGEKTNRVAEIAKNYGQLISLKTGKLMVGYKAAFTCCYALYNVATIYFLTYSVHLDNKYTSYMYYITVAVFLISTPLINKMALRMGKVRQQIFSMLLCGVTGVLVYFIAPSSIVGVALYMASFAYMQTSFWQMSSAIFYDVIEVDEWVHHKRREGDLMSMISVLGTLISAIMVQFFGIVMDSTGFDAALQTQPDTVVTFLNAAFILVPALCLIAGAAILHFFPINKTTFESICKALDARKNGEDYSEYMADVNKILGKKHSKKTEEQNTDL